MFEFNTQKVAQLEGKVKDLTSDKASLERKVEYRDETILELNRKIKTLELQISEAESADELYLAERENDIAKEYEKQYAPLKKELADAKQTALEANAALTNFKLVIDEKDKSFAAVKEFAMFLGTKIPDFKEIDLAKQVAPVTVNNSSNTK